VQSPGTAKKKKKKKKKKDFYKTKNWPIAYWNWFVSSTAQAPTVPKPYYYFCCSTGV
jgi:hypothetical protein